MMMIRKMIKKAYVHQPRVLFTILVLSQLIISQVSADENKQEITKGSNSAEPEPKPNIGRMGDSAIVDPDEFEFSFAERKIWLSDHLENVDKPVRLYYEFIKGGTYEEGFTDAVYLDIYEINKDGSKNASLDFFTSDRQQKANTDNLTNITGNPVIGIYMQGDVLEMNRIAKGHWRYFQRRVKFAISEDAKVEAISFDFDGKTMQGEKISITPYAKDPRRNQFSQFADKLYEFIFSDQIPGTLYQIKTVIPDKSGTDKEPLIEETLTLKNTDFRN
jgi:hypothetical protein